MIVEVTCRQLSAHTLGTPQAHMSPSTPTETHSPDLPGAMGPALPGNPRATAISWPLKSVPHTFILTYNITFGSSATWLMTTLAITYEPRLDRMYQVKGLRASYPKVYVVVLFK